MRLRLDLDLDALGDDSPGEAARILRHWADVVGRLDLAADARHEIMDPGSRPVGEIVVAGSAADAGGADGEVKRWLHGYLTQLHEGLLWKIEGLGERDARWPMTPTGTNLLALVKDVASVESEYLGLVFDRPFPEELPWSAEDAGDNADMWAWPEETIGSVRAFAERVWAHGDATITALDLGAVGRVPWWREQRVTFGRVLVHVVVEVARHLGHADIVRELTDGGAGLLAGNENLPDHDADWWAAHISRLQQVAEEAGEGARTPDSPTP